MRQPFRSGTRYDPETREALGPAVPVEATDKTAAARQVCGFKVAGGAGPRTAAASVIALGDAPNRREYFSRA